MGGWGLNGIGPQRIPASEARLRAQERQRQKQYADELWEWWCKDCMDSVTTVGKWTTAPVCMICFNRMEPYSPIPLPPSSK